MLRFAACTTLIITNNARSLLTAINTQETPSIVHPAKNVKVKNAFTKATNVSELESALFNQPLYEPGNPTDWRLWTAIYVNNEPLAQDMINTYPDYILHNKNHTDMVNAVGIVRNYNYKPSSNRFNKRFMSTLGLAITRKMNNVTHALLKKSYINVNVQSPEYSTKFTILSTPLLVAIRSENDNVLRSLLRHSDIDVSLDIYGDVQKNETVIDYAGLNHAKMIPIIQKEMCDFIERAHKKEKKKRDQFLKHIPNEKECDYIQNNIAYDSDNKGSGESDKSGSKTTSSTTMIVIGVVAMALGAIILCYFFLKPVLLKKRANQENDEVAA